MENTIIKVKDLQVGDEVITKGYELRYLKILREPKPRDLNLPYSGNYRTVKCLEMYDKVGGNAIHNREVYYDFNYAGVWLVKRDGQWKQQ